MNVDLRYLLRRFWHRFPWFLVTVLLFCGLGVTMALVLPTVYRSQAKLLVESPQISAELAASTVNTGAPEALQIIQQRMLTRDSLISLAKRMKIYDGLPPMTDDKIVIDMRTRLTIVLPDTSAAASFVLVTFDAPKAQMAADVATEVVNMILKENVDLRTATATQTLDFFKQEVDTLGQQLGPMGAKIMQYKLDHKDALPDSLEFRRTRQSAQQERLVELQREIASLKDRRVRLVEIFQATGNVNTPAAARSPEEVQLQDAKNQLAAAEAIYAPTHPTVVTLKAKIKALEEAMLAGASGQTSDGVVVTGNTTYDMQLADIDSQLSFDANQQAQIEQELTDLKVSLDATPGNAIELDALQRDYDNVQTQYDDAVARMGQAKTGDRIEALSKGQRISVIEEAVVPTLPTSPKRKLIAIVSGLAGIALGLGLVFLLEKLDRAVHRPADLASKLGIQAFGSVPYIRTRREVLQRRMTYFGVALVLLVGLPTLLFAINQYYLPLDVLIGRALGKT